MGEHIELVLRVVGIQVLLQHMVANGVAVFMLSVLLSKLLKTVVRKVDIIIAILKIVVVA
jgi:hypothetical protein